MTRVSIAGVDVSDLIGIEADELHADSPCWELARIVYRRLAQAGIGGFSELPMIPLRSEMRAHHVERLLALGEACEPSAVMPGAIAVFGDGSHVGIVTDQGQVLDCPKNGSEATDRVRAMPLYRVRDRMTGYYMLKS